MDRIMLGVRIVIVGGPFVCMFVVLSIIGLGPAFIELRTWWRTRCALHS
jgi:hypothetical protein